MTDNSNVVIRWEIDNVGAKLDSGKVESGIFDEGGFRWTLAVNRVTRPEEMVDFTLRCEVEHNRPWNCEAEVDMVVRRSSGAEMLICPKKRVCFDEQFCSWLHESSLPWQHPTLSALLDWENVANITFEFKAKIINSDRGEQIADPSEFAAPNRMSNVILKIEDVKIYVSKEFLSVYSPVFEALFFGEFAEKGKEEVEIKDVVYEEFINLLLVMYPGQFTITDSIVEHILALCDRFQIKHVINLAETHLRMSKKFTTAEKLRLAEQYRLGELRDSCLRTYKSVRECGTLKSTPEYANFSDATKAAICDRMMKLVEEMG